MKSKKARTLSESEDVTLIADAQPEEVSDFSVVMLPRKPDFTKQSIGSQLLNSSDLVQHKPWEEKLKTTRLVPFQHLKVGQKMMWIQDVNPTALV